MLVLWVLSFALFAQAHAQTFRVIRVYGAGTRARDAKQVKQALFSIVEYYRRESFTQLHIVPLAKPSKVKLDCATIEPFLANLKGDRQDIIILPKGCGVNAVVGKTVVVKDLIPYAMARDIAKALGLGFAAYRNGGNPMTIMGSATNLHAARFTLIERTGLRIAAPFEVTVSGEYRFPFKVRYNHTWLWCENGYVEMGELRAPNRLIAFGTFVSPNLTLNWPNVWIRP